MGHRFGSATNLAIPFDVATARMAAAGLTRVIVTLGYGADAIAAHLAGRDWLVGNRCTIADIGCFGRMVFMAEGGLSLDHRPHARPAG